MANSSGKYGLKPVGKEVRPPEMFNIDPTTSIMGYGDMVEIVADNGVALAAAGNEDNLGVCVGVVDADGVPVNYYPGSSPDDDTYKALIITDPQQRYAIKCTSALSSADVGGTGDIVLGDASSSTGISTSYMATTSTGNANLKVLGLLKTQGNAWGANQDIVVVIHEHSMGGSTVTEGV